MPHPTDAPRPRSPGAAPRRFGAGGISLGRLAGVRIQVDWSLLIIFALVTFSMGAQVLPGWHPDWSAALRWGVALVAALTFFASVLAHEMSHALVGRWQGIPIRRITLFLFGGMAHMEKEPPSPKAELLMAGVGPLTSIAIGVGSTLLAGALLDPEVAAELASSPATALAKLSPGQTILLWLGPINVLLGVFNLVPGFPLDGGRVFRALVWWVTGDMVRATRWATATGRSVAILLMATGAAMAVGVNVPWFGTGLGSGLWLLLIGWFLHKAAHGSYQQVLLRQALDGVTVAELMRQRVDVVSPDATVDVLMRDHVMQSDQDAFPVVANGRLVGLITARSAMAVPPHAWTTTPVQAVMTFPDDVPTVSPAEDASQALRLFEQKQVGMLPVVEHGELRGTLHGRDVLTWLRLHDDIGGAHPA